MAPAASDGHDDGVGLLAEQLDRVFPGPDSCQAQAHVRTRRTVLAISSAATLLLVAVTIVVHVYSGPGRVALTLFAILTALGAAATIAWAFTRSARCVDQHRSALAAAGAVFEGLTEGVIVLSHEDRVVACNGSAASILGVSVSEILGRPFDSPLAWLVRDDGSRLAPEEHPVAIVRATGLPCKDTIMGIQKPSGHLVWLSVSAAPLGQSASPWSDSIVCTVWDVSRQRQDDQALIAREAQLRQTLAGSPLALWSVDAESRLSLILGGLAPTLLEDRDLIGRPIGELFVEDPQFQVTVDRALDGETLTLQSHCRGMIFDTRISPARDSTGRVIGASGISIDVTAKERAEAEHGALRDALRRAAAEWRATFDTIDSPVLVVASNGLVHRVNRATQLLWGDPFEKIVGSPLPSPTRGAPWSAIARSVSACQASGRVEAVGDSDREGRQHWDVVTVPLRGEREIPEGVVVVARDVSRVVNLRESLRHSERMAVMGQLVGGVAHQARNPLFGISSTLDAFDVEFSDRPELKEYSALLRHEANRLSRLMSDLLQYGKPARMTLRPYTVEAMLQAVARACEAVARAADVTLRSTVAEGLPSITMDPQRLEEAIRNVVENAIQHSPERGEVQIRAFADAPGADRPRLLCEVRDTGPGFRPDDIPRLFEPFFTRRSGGTGLGLSLAQRIVEEHGGSISARNRPEGGGLVVISLPIQLNPLGKEERRDG